MAALDERDVELMQVAFATAAQCTPIASAFNVGAVLTDSRRVILTTGFSRETGIHEHAEEVAFAKAAAQGLETVGGFLYVTLEPCGIRKSKPKSCSMITLDKGISRVAYAVREPPLFVKEQSGLELLQRAAVEVIRIPGFEATFRQLHVHLLR
jgi:diaminohydroxyphosphoribosylaminopyrimidine deaminase / 5-amino-6-(5-phosphoribosylamino)uracil reductase